MNKGCIHAYGTRDETDTNLPRSPHERSPSPDIPHATSEVTCRDIFLLFLVLIFRIRLRLALRARVFIIALRVFLRLRLSLRFQLKRLDGRRDGAYSHTPLALFPRKSVTYLQKPVLNDGELGVSEPDGRDYLRGEVASLCVVEEHDLYIGWSVGRHMVTGRWVDTYEFQRNDDDTMK